MRNEPKEIVTAKVQKYAVGDFIKCKREAELDFVACAMADKNRALAEFAYLNPETFIDLSAKEFWKELLATKDEMKALDAVKDSGAILDRMAKIPNTSRIDFYADKLEKFRRLIALYNKATEIAKALANEDETQALQIINTAAADVVDNTRSEALKTATDASMEVVEWLESKIDGLKTMIAPVDKGLGRMQRGNLYLLAARTSIGKSAVAYQIARTNAVSGLTVLYCTTELNTRYLWIRGVCGAAEIDYRKMIGGEATDYDKSKFFDKNFEMEKGLTSNLIFDDKARTIEDVHQAVALKKPDLLIVDHVEEIRPVDGSRDEDNRVLHLENVARGLRDMAKKYNMVVMGVHQLSRQVEYRQNHLPVLADLRWSGALEQIADAVLMLHREDVYMDIPPKERVVPMQLIVRKNNVGPRDVFCNVLYDLLGQWIYDNQSLPPHLANQVAQVS